MLLFRHGRGQSRTAQMTSPRRSWRTGPAVGELLDRHPGELVGLPAGHAEPVRRPALRFGIPEHGNTGTPTAGDPVVVQVFRSAGFHPAVVRNSASSRDHGSSVARSGRESLTAANTALTGRRRSPAPTQRRDRRRRATSAGTDAGRSVSSRHARGRAAPEPRPTRLPRPTRWRRIRVAAGADAPSETSLLAATAPSAAR